MNIGILIIRKFMTQYLDNVLMEIQGGPSISDMK